MKKIRILPSVKRASNHFSSPFLTQTSAQTRETGFFRCCFSKLERNAATMRGRSQIVVSIVLLLIASCALIEGSFFSSITGLKDVWEILRGSSNSKDYRLASALETYRSIPYIIEAILRHYLSILPIKTSFFFIPESIDWLFFSIRNYLPGRWIRTSWWKWYNHPL